MSKEYDLYLEQHKNAVRQALYWIMDNLPTLIPEENQLELVHQIGFAHDASKSNPEEYIPYDAYFYGGNRSHQVVEEYEYAWLIHIHNNPHHWQYWILHHDDPEEAETIMDMPYNYILEMICDWWSFSWKTGNLYEIFDWYDERKDYMKLSDKTQKIVENILEKIKWKLDDERGIIEHSGRPGMKWGVRNGPPYPIDKYKDRGNINIIQKAIDSGEIKTTINVDKQKRHTKLDHLAGRSYLNGGCEYAQELVDKHCGKGEAILDRKGNWTNKERFVDDNFIGVHTDTDGNETKTKRGVIAYSKTGSHVYPA